MRVYGQAVMGFVEGFGQARRSGRVTRRPRAGDGDQVPAAAVKQGRRQHRQRGDAVKENRDSEPEKRHAGVSVFG